MQKGENIGKKHQIVKKESGVKSEKNDIVFAKIFDVVFNSNFVKKVNPDSVSKWL
jgi:hypothetical protein